MRALLIGYHWQQLGGLEVVSRHVGRALMECGNDVEFWAVRESGQFDDDGIKVIGLCPCNKHISRADAKWFWKRRLARRVGRDATRFDLIVAVHAHMLGPLKAGMSGLAGPRPRCGAWVHGREIWGPPGEHMADELAWADWIVSVSQFTADQIVRWVDAKRVCVIPNAVDLDDFAPLSDTSKINRDEVLIVGRLSKQARNKGYENLIRALPLVEENLGRSIKLTIVGDGDDRSRLEHVAVQLGLKKQVCFRGRISREELIEAYRCCGVFVMPSRIERGPDRWWGEGFGIVYIEAAACGRPVIASTDGGAPETIQPGVTGLLVDPRNTGQIAEAIAKVLSDPEQADAMGKAGRRWVESNFTLLLFRERVRQLLADGV